jgi:hypothetical protein
MTDLGTQRVTLSLQQLPAPSALSRRAGPASPRAPATPPPIEHPVARQRAVPQIFPFLAGAVAAILLPGDGDGRPIERSSDPPRDATRTLRFVRTTAKRKPKASMRWALDVCVPLSMSAECRDLPMHTSERCLIESVLLNAHITFIKNTTNERTASLCLAQTGPSIIRSPA